MIYRNGSPHRFASISRASSKKGGQKGLLDCPNRNTKGISGNGVIESVVLIVYQVLYFPYSNIEHRK